MDDMGSKTKLFEISSKLQNASIWLKKIAKNEQLDAKGTDILYWAGQFLCEVDWSSKIAAKPSVSGCLTVQATSVRPTFYSSLIRIAPKLQAEGMKTETDILKFVRVIYSFLLSVKSSTNDTKKPLPRECDLAAMFLSEISDSILIQLNNNGLPRNSVSLKNEWELNRNGYIEHTV